MVLPLAPADDVGTGGGGATGSYGNFVTDESGGTQSVATTSSTPSGDDADKVFAYSGSYGNNPENAPEYVIVDQNEAGETVYFNANIDDNGAVTRGRELAVGDKSADPLAQLDDALNTNETNLAAARSRRTFFLCWVNLGCSLLDREFSLSLSSTMNRLLVGVGFFMVRQAWREAPLRRYPVNRGGWPDDLGVKVPYGP